MSRIGRESIAGPGRRAPPVTGRRRVMAVEEMEAVDLDLFMRSRKVVPVDSADESDGLNLLMKPGKTSIGSVKLSRGGTDDLLLAEMGKHDYDWLLSPPGTPLAGENNPRLFSTAPRSSSVAAKPTSIYKASKFPLPQSETGHSPRPLRSSPVTRASISNHYSTSSNKTSVLNMSMAFLTSSRPSTPGRTRSTAPPSPRPIPTATTPRASTPTRPRPSTATASRPSTPTARPQMPSVPRPSTPTQRVTTTSPPNPVPARSTSVGRTRTPATNGPIPARGSSPGPRARQPPQPIVLPDLPLEPPQNIRTKLPDRPTSAGRTRPGAAVTPRSSSISRPSSPAIRGRFPDNDMTVRRASKPASVAAESAGFGRTISKKSMDMALKHMDIRNSMGSIRGTSLFPQSVRSSASRGAKPACTVSENGRYATSGNGDATIVDKHVIGYMSPIRMFDPDIYGSSRYEAMLLEEDSKNTNWLHGPEERSDQSLVFDHRFELLPEPFELL
ncbi:hypothetical protein QJS04_geneDACA016982 [Acorus gramineus]|uniref:Uncharacterized protein n=1 Tax=Acorus gramineus TaxID=55184 RepID=A0AAV9AL32_ACOGR|nr:hypothetical protein QJS04_geneDACA016982 [Acorus gramineus]